VYALIVATKKMADQTKTKELQTIPKVPLANSLDAYIQWANSIPLLSLEEEQELATKLQQKNDLNAAQKLVTSHLKYVIKVARGYMGYGLMLGDLIQEGTIGLMKAVKKFQPTKGVRLVSFAVHWVKAEIHEFVLRNWRIVRVATTKAQRKLFFNLKSRKGLSWLSAEEANIIAKDLNVKPEEVLLMERRLFANDTPLEMPVIAEDNSEHNFAPIDYLEAKDADPAKLLEHNNWDDSTKQKFALEFQRLDARSKDILENRWLIETNKATLQDLALKYNISSERVRQLEQKALRDLRSKMVADDS
jgi:RNA polymerase sigma-32 factor